MPGHYWNQVKFQVQQSVVKVFPIWSCVSSQFWVDSVPVERCLTPCWTQNKIKLKISLNERLLGSIGLDLKSLTAYFTVPDKSIGENPICPI